MLEGRRAAEAGVRAALSSLGVAEKDKPSHLDDNQAKLRRGLRAKQRQLGGEFEVLVWDAAYEQWHRLLFARFLAENGLLVHPEFGAPVTLAECEELAAELGEPDGWSVAAQFASQILPGIFRLDDPCVRLRLAPEHRVALERIVADLPAEVLTADDSLGWVYQYWQSERKDQVNASEVKIGGADLGPVTQLFTENYMVRFLLENSLGAWWAGKHPDSPLLKEFEYLRFDDDGNPAAGTFEGWPDAVGEVTVMDPCCGSGHFLVEAFGMLWRMRAEEEGLDPVAAQDAVLRDNLFGLELDPRCVQIAMFAVALTAWKQGGGWRQLPTPNIACSGIPARAPLEEWTALADGDSRLEMALERLHALFKDADTLGSLIDPRRAAEMANAAGLQKTMWDVDFDEVAPLLEMAATRETDDPATAVLGADAAGIARAGMLLSRTFTLIATNVPYLGRGKQSESLQAFAERHFGPSSADLATMFVERAVRALVVDGALAAVTPENWLFLDTYRGFREEMLRRTTWRLAVRLGAGAFSAISGEVVKPVLLALGATSPGPSSESATIRLGDGPTVARARELKTRELVHVSQEQHGRLPGTRFVFEALPDASPLGEVAKAHQGIKTGDNDYYLHYFWEHPAKPDSPWLLSLSSPSGTVPYSGRETALRCDGVEPAQAQWARVQGLSAWGRAGIAVASVGSLRGGIYSGEPFDSAPAVVVPGDASLVPALWAFAESGELERLVRLLDSKLAVTTATFEAVPFDAERWQHVAAEEYPHGLPQPWSNDPTQWLFEGDLSVATEPLQAGIVRLVGYRWPKQPASDGLEGHADSDGIVCLPAVGGERPAAARLMALLSDAFGGEWSPTLVRTMLEAAGSTKKTLEDWLRDDFFKHHCKVFSHRPFVWHVWDGRKDGFSALVNYHRLDRAGLEKLTFSYLGDWIERQRADADQDVAGADARLAAARDLRGKLEQILEGEKPFDIYVRWKELHEQPIGWDPDLDDGVRLNIRPFVKADVLRSKVNVHWKKDRGKNPNGSERHNDIHLTLAEKREARSKATADG